MKVFLKLMSSGVLIQLLMMVSTLIFARLFSSSQFGELALYASYGSVLAVIGGLRFDYISLKDSISINDKFSGYLLANICSVIINIFLFAILMMIDIYTTVIKDYVIFDICLFGLSYSLFNNLTQYYIANKEYEKFITYRLLQVFLIFIIGITLYLTRNNGLALIYAYSYSQLILSIIGFLIVIFKCFNNRSIKNCKLFFQKHYHTSLKNTLISFMQCSTPLAPVLIGGLLFTNEKIGAYFIFAQMVSSPLSIFRRNLLIFLNGEFNSILKFRLLILQLHRNLVYLIIPLVIITIGLIVLSTFSKEFISLIIGSQWIQYSYLLIPLSIYFISDAVGQPLTTLLPLWGYVNYSIKAEAVRFIFIFIFLPILTFSLNLSFITFLSLFIITMLSIYIAIVMKTIIIALKEV